MSKRYKGNQGGKKYVPSVQSVEKLVTVYDGELVSPEKQVLIDFECSKTSINGKEMYDFRKLCAAMGQDPKMYHHSRRAIKSAIAACKKATNSPQATVYAMFTKFGEDVYTSHGAKHTQENYWLTPYACKMVIQELPSNHINVAILRDHFAYATGEYDKHKAYMIGKDPARVQARTAHVDGHIFYGNKIVDAGGNQWDIANLTSEADKAFYGKTTAEKKAQHGIDKSVPMANHETPMALALKTAGKYIAGEAFENGKPMAYTDMSNKNTAVFSGLRDLSITHANLDPADYPVHKDALPPPPKDDRPGIQRECTRLLANGEVIDIENIQGDDIEGLIDNKTEDYTEYLPDTGKDRSFCIYDTELKTMYIGNTTRGTARSLANRGINISNAEIGKMVTSGEYMHGKYLVYSLYDHSPALNELKRKYQKSTKTST